MKTKSTLAAFTALAAAVSTASAVTYVWTGGDGIGGGGSGTNWYDVANWDGGVAPHVGGTTTKISSPIATAATDIAIFDSEMSLLNYMPTGNIDLVRVGGGDYPPNIDLRNGTLNLNRAENYGFGSTYTIGDGDLTTSAVFHMAATINLNRAGSSMKTYVVNADGTLSFGSNFTWSSNDAVVQLLGGALNTNGNTISGMTDDTGEYASFEAAGSTFTAGFGGSFVLGSDVTDAFGDSFRLGGALASDGSTLSYTDNGNSTFTVGVVPEPTTTALLGLGGLALILRRRK